MVQYWRSTEQLLAYAKNRDAEHLPAWKAFNQAVGTNGDVNVGIGVGRRPPLSSTEENRPPNPSPRMEIGSGDDIFSVYRGGGQYPLDAPPLWRYSAKNALQHPSVPAVDKFRKAIEEAEKAKP